MKHIYLLVLIVVFSTQVHAQGFFSTNAYSTSVPRGVGANSLFGWGENSSSTIDVRPNPGNANGTMMINYHTGITFSAHSYYGGIRFYNQGYPNPYDSSTGATMVMSITNNNVGIGTTNPDQKLTVNGMIHASSVKVDTNIPVPDYVFQKDYKLTNLSALAAYIDKNHHLPEIPSAAELESKGMDVGKMNLLLLKKVEELTLHLINTEKKVRRLQQANAVIKKSLKKFNQK
ncbi:hypothetical protein CKK33_06580 [Mucilaginibacter sp. MD40]|uniref:hypothetical protein n=1 Tax=Mucilaginibacter sp. MD40 TaxID=2029590 RepID=UPI000BACCE7A|nr:hypothetical protein [Mucilaginibacter sp. MD40]PAW93177.1 hypothetical protein CKK33_06580 [Mucilaginibacter sp. MD40]